MSCSSSMFLYFASYSLSCYPTQATRPPHIRIICLCLRSQWSTRFSRKQNLNSPHHGAPIDITYTSHPYLPTPPLNNHTFPTYNHTHFPTHTNIQKFRIIYAIYLPSRSLTQPYHSQDHCFAILPRNSQSTTYAYRSMSLCSA